ncbi:MAG: hypothetical protein U0263_06760 [Polyangiaceae bacterium]
MSFSVALLMAPSTASRTSSWRAALSSCSIKRRASRSMRAPPVAFRQDARALGFASFAHLAFQSLDLFVDVRELLLVFAQTIGGVFLHARGIVHALHDRGLALLQRLESAIAEAVDDVEENRRVEQHAASGGCIPLGRNKRSVSCRSRREVRSTS